MEASVKNRVALIVGAGDEIGAAIALQLASDGVQLALAGAARDKLEALAERVADRGAKVLAIEVDTTDPASIAACIRRALTQFERIDILVNNAGEVVAKPLRALSAGDVGAAVDTALAAPFHFIREVVSVMQENGFGRIVNISELGYLCLANQANAAAARAGLFGLTRSAALETARDGVTVNTVVKGDIATAATSEAMSEAEKEKLANGIPVKRLGTADDVARAVRFFATDSAKYLTGQTLFVCGGKSAYFSMSM